MGNKQAVGPKLDFSHPLLGNTVEYQSNVGTIVKYNDPNDIGCSVAEFSIEDHPDFKNYIRKDKIPCWGCDLT